MNNWDEYYKKSISEKPSLILQKFFDLGLNINLTNKRAIDLGCGAGNDTVFLLTHGFSVMSIDKEESVVDIIKNRISSDAKVEFIIDKFGGVVLPSTNLVVANFSIPFCHPKFFDKFCTEITGCIVEGRLLCRKFFRIRR